MWPALWCFRSWLRIESAPLLLRFAFGCSSECPGQNDQNQSTKRMIASYKMEFTLSSKLKLSSFSSFLPERRQILYFYLFIFFSFLSFSSFYHFIFLSWFYWNFVFSSSLYFFILSFSSLRPIIRQLLSFYFLSFIFYPSYLSSLWEENCYQCKHNNGKHLSRPSLLKSFQNNCFFDFLLLVLILKFLFALSSNFFDFKPANSSVV